MKNLDVVALGELLIDFTPAGLSPGALIHSFHSLEKLYLMQNGPLELQNILPSTPAAVFSSLQGVASMAVVFLD